MTEQQNPYPSEDQPVASSTPPPPGSTATGTTGTAEKDPTPGRGRRWLAGAMLVTVGLVAGSGATYAFTNDPTGTGTGTGTGGQNMRGYGFPGGGMDGGMGVPPGAPGQTGGTQTEVPQGTTSADGESI